MAVYMDRISAQVIGIKRIWKFIGMNRVWDF